MASCLADDETDRIAAALTPEQRRALMKGRATGEDFVLAMFEPALVKPCLCCLNPLGISVRQSIIDRRNKGGAE